jgi:hypothetical protein
VTVLARGIHRDVAGGFLQAVLLNGMRQFVRQQLPACGCLRLIVAEFSGGTQQEDIQLEGR